MQTQLKDVSNTDPPYIQIASSLRKEIFSGSLLPGQRMPSVRELAKEINVAPGTIQASYKILIQEGFIKKTLLGTIVCNTKEIISARQAAINYNIKEFSNKMLKRGFELSEIKNAFRNFIRE